MKDFNCSRLTDHIFSIAFLRFKDRFIRRLRLCVKNERINDFWHYRELRVKGNRLTQSFLVLL